MLQGGAPGVLQGGCSRGAPGVLQGGCSGGAPGGVLQGEYLRRLRATPITMRQRYTYRHATVIQLYLYNNNVIIVI